MALENEIKKLSCEKVSIIPDNNKPQCTLGKKEGRARIKVRLINIIEMSAVPLKSLHNNSRQGSDRALREVQPV